MGPTCSRRSRKLPMKGKLSLSATAFFFNAWCPPHMYITQTFNFVAVCFWIRHVLATSVTWQNCPPPRGYVFLAKATGSKLTLLSFINHYHHVQFFFSKTIFNQKDFTLFHGNLKPTSYVSCNDALIKWVYCIIYHYQGQIQIWTLDKLNIFLFS